MSTSPLVPPAFSPRRLGRPPRPVRSVRLHAGQGDVLMAVHGLEAMRALGVPCLAAAARVYTRCDTASLVQRLLPDLDVRPLTESRHAPHPRYVIVERTSVSTVLRNWLYPDYYVNFPERRLVRSYGYPRPGLAHRWLMRLTDWRYGTPSNRDHETPCYYAIKMWAPLAGRWGLSELDLVRGLYRAYPALRARLLEPVMSGRLRTEVPSAPVAFFPSGRGFQFIPPGFLRRLIEAAKLGEREYLCYFGPRDAAIEEYRRLGLACASCPDVESALGVVARAEVTVTCDSFSSHLAQLAAREHVALMSHDLPLHTVHPAAPSRIVFEPQDCCPCYYTIRDTATTCRAGRPECGVYASERYFRSAVEALHAARAAGTGR